VIRRDPGILEAGPACLKSGTARLCSAPIQLSRAADAAPAVLDLTLDQYDLERLAPWLPPTVSLGGLLSAEARLRGNEVDLQLRPAAARLLLRDPDSAEVVFEDAFQDARLDASWGPGGLAGDLRLRADAAGTLEIEGTLGAAPTLAEGTLDLSARFALEDLAVVSPFLTAVEAPTGSVHGTLRVGGTPAAPSFAGEANARATAFVPALGRTVDLVELRARGANGEAMHFDARLDFDSHPLVVDGDVRYGTTTGLAGAITLAGEDLPVVALPDLALWISPDLTASLAGGVLTVDGTLDLPRARVVVTSLPASGPTRSPDVVIHRPEQDLEEQPLQARGRVDLALGDDVQLAAGSLRTQLVGNLELGLELDRTVTARGRIETRGGTVTRFGRELAIARGALAFDGPLLSPDVTVTASRRIDDQEVGVTITGPPDALETVLFSDPAMDDATALTMLVTGRTPATVRPEDAERVSAAAFGLGIGTANPFLQGVGARLGLEEFGIDTGTGAVVAGTQLSDRLYARYNYGLTTRASGLQIEYRISDRLSARTESGPVHALDLLYRREFD
jgi:translocation and assembly module TamB